MPQATRSQRYDNPVEQRIARLEENLVELRKRHCGAMVKHGEKELLFLRKLALEEAREEAGGGCR